MTEIAPPHPALLPAGLRDLLPVEAQTEARSVEMLMGIFEGHGYARVKPPLMEFEDTLLAGAGAAIGDQCFRIMDPDSHRMMALRADMTPQVARIAATRLANAPRPLRLSYAGQCIRVRGQLDTDRQVPQAGIELIGADSPHADAEAMLVAAEALAALGLRDLSLDLTLPTLAPALLEEAGLDEAGLDEAGLDEAGLDAAGVDAAGVDAARRQALGRALDRKDAAAITALGGRLAPMLTDLLLAAGPADAALAALARAPLPAASRLLAERLADLVALLRAQAPHLRLTIDPLEFRGFRYHTGVAMTFFAAGRHEELGRGGRYLCGNAEPATGVTLFADAVLRAAPPLAGRPTLLIPLGTDPDLARRLRAEFITIAALQAGDAPREARRLGCSHVLRDGVAVSIDK